MGVVVLRHLWHNHDIRAGFVSVVPGSAVDPDVTFSIAGSQDTKKEVLDTVLKYYFICLFILLLMIIYYLDLEPCAQLISMISVNETIFYT